jgi:hypothetical protein
MHAGATPLLHCWFYLIPIESYNHTVSKFVNSTRDLRRVTIHSHGEGVEALGTKV